MTLAFEEIREELKRKKEEALQQGGAEKIKTQHRKGRLTARERIDRVLDPGSFVEFGLLSTSDMPGMQEKTPADGVILGYGLINGRKVGLVANDFTVLASSNGRIHVKKVLQFKEQIKK